MSDALLAVVTAITELLGPAAGPLSGGLPVVILLAAIAVLAALLPAAARSGRAEEVAHRG